MTDIFDYTTSDERKVPGDAIQSIRAHLANNNWADVGDIPSAAVEREVLEEAGFEVKARKVIGIYDANRTGPLEVFHAFKIVFLCDIISGEPRPSDETSEVAFFAQHEIPQALSGERTRPRHIQDAFTALEKDLPTIFD